MVEGNEIAFDGDTFLVLSVVRGDSSYTIGGMVGPQEFYDNIEVTITEDDSKGCNNAMGTCIELFRIMEVYHCHKVH